jgi:dTDP-glucose pyrophosphorylase
MNKDWRQIVVAPTTPMREVMQVIDRAGTQLALVTDEDGHLLGIATDGDIRRALLRGENLDTPVTKFMNANPVTGLVDEDPAVWQRTMQRHSLRFLPLLDASGCVRELVRVEAITEPARDNLVVLMAGGLGTRLRPLTEHEPKPLLKVGDKPILETIIENFIAQGFHRFKLCINYRGQMIRNHFGDGSRWGAQIEYVEEHKRLGTAGALGLLPQRPQQPFFVMNGDLLTKVDFVRLLEFHKKQGNAATMCVREYRYQIPYGVVQLDQYRITRLKEKPVQYYNVNAGIYLLEPSVLSEIPADQYFDMTTLLEQMIVGGAQVGSFPLREYWMDIGRMEDFEQADNEYAEHFS